VVLSTLEEPEEAEAHRDQTHTRGNMIINTTTVLHTGNRTIVNGHPGMLMSSVQIKMPIILMMRMKRIR